MRKHLKKPGSVTNNAALSTLAVLERQLLKHPAQLLADTIKAQQAALTQLFKKRFEAELNPKFIFDTTFLTTTPTRMTLLPD